MLAAVRNPAHSGCQIFFTQRIHAGGEGVGGGKIIGIAARLQWPPCTDSKVALLGA
jgi:hypothetical protein